MNTNPSARRILCFGDSNTWGQRPDKTGRFPSDIRWTGRTQNELGPEYEILEEGLSSRTTDLEYSTKLGRGGKSYLLPCLVSHTPLDLVVIMLGTNDVKKEFHRSARQIADAIGGLVALVKEYAKDRQDLPSNVLVMSPVPCDADKPLFDQFYQESYGAEGALLSKELAPEIRLVAARENVIFFDAATVANVGVDGVHLSEESHARLAHALAGIIRDRFPISISG